MKRLAIAHGDALDFEMPAHFQDALSQSIQAKPDGHFLLIDGHGHQVSSSYAQVWSEALKTLNGLKESGCKAGDIFILDAEDVTNFIPALWAVMLGGMTAVPLARSRWNANAVHEFQARLDRLASQLNHPPILSNSPQVFQAGKSRLMEYRSLREFPEVDSVSCTDSEQPAVLISTSGTTGHAQLVSLSGRAVMHRWWPSNPLLPTQTKFLGWTPLDHVMGLGMAAPNYQKKIYLPPELFVRNPALWLELIETHRVTHSVMTNFGMRILSGKLDPGASWDLSSLKRIGVGAEMISPGICADFTRHLIQFGMPDDAVILGYGLSECGPVAGGQRSYTLTGMVDEQAPLLIDQPTKGHAIRIVNDQGSLCEMQQHGRIEVCGPTMTSGYHADPSANQHLFTSDGWLRTGDLGYLSDEYLFVTGREKETLSINAKKISCNEIDAAIRNIPGVEFAHVFAVGDLLAGQRPVSLIYGTKNPAEDRSAAEKIIRKACVEKFGFGLARCVHVRPEQLPRTHSGKLQRHKLEELIAQEPTTPLPPPPTAAMSLELQIRSIMSRFLSGTYPGAADNFFDLGGDSLGALSFTVAVESELKVSLPPVVFTGAPTSKAVAEYLENKPSEFGKLALIPVQKGSGDGVLYLAPGIWGNNAYAAQFSGDMGPAASVWTFHLTDPENRQAHMGTMAGFARECCRLIREIQPQGPYHLAGFSFGGLLAYEMARQLASEGLVIGTLSIIDATAKLEERNFGAAARLPLSDSKFVIQHYRRLMNAYLAEPVHCKVNYFRARDSPFLARSDVTGGWGYLAGQGVEIFDIAGDHQSVIRGQSLTHIATTMQKIIRGQHDGDFYPPLIIAGKSRLLIHEGRKAAIKGDVVREIRALSSALSGDENLPHWVYANFSEALFLAGRVEQAKQAYLSALARDPWPLTTYKRFAPALKKHNLATLAREAIKAASAVEIDGISTAYAKAKICGELGSAAAALENLGCGLELMPECLELRCMRANLLVKLNRVDDARQEIRNALLYPMENDVIFLRLGKLALRVNDFDLATRCLQQTIAINPAAPDAFYLLSGISQARGNLKVASALREKARSAQQGMRLNRDSKGPGIFPAASGQP